MIKINHIKIVELIKNFFKVVIFEIWVPDTETVIANGTIPRTFESCDQGLILQAGIAAVVKSLTRDDRFMGAS